MDSSAASKRPRPTESPRKSPTTKKKKTLSAASRESKQRYDRGRAGTRINIGYAFNSWRKLQLELGLKTDADMANFLVTRCREKQSEDVTQGRNDRRPSKRKAAKISHPSSPIEPVSEEIEEDANGSNPEDSDYMPPVCLRAAGGLQHANNAVPIVGLNESVIDILHRNDKTDKEHDNPRPDEEIDNHKPSFPGPKKVSIEEDLVNQPACIAFNSSLAIMVNFLQLPIQKCFYRDDRTGTGCDATPPFQVKFKQKGSATIIEWVCIHGHELWKWNSQPVLKRSMQGGDFMVVLVQ